MTLFDLSGHAAGGGSASATPYRVLIFSAQPQGAGTLSDGLLITLSGLADGTGILAGIPVREVGLFGQATGAGQFVASIPEQIFGRGEVSAFIEVLKVPTPPCNPACACEQHPCDECEEVHRRFFRGCDPSRDWRVCRDCWWRHEHHRRDRYHHHRLRFESRACRDIRGHDGPRKMPVFRWRDVFQQGDIEILLEDRFGNRRDPVFIGYTMLMAAPTGVLLPVGPEDHKPARASTGRYYVTGTAGEGGQPGCFWAVRWRYQRSYGEPIIEVIGQFRVLDTVLAHDPHDITQRKCKYGWGDDT